MKFKSVTTAGLALFAMFFGAGNLVFPLQLGANAYTHFATALTGFLITGVGLPFLGLIAISFSEGDYWAFFKPLGRIFSFVIVTALILFIGPLVCIPRTEAVTYQSLLSFLPGELANRFVFDAIYCAIIYAFAHHHTHVVNVVGRVLSPIKLTAFFTLIIVGLMIAPAPAHSSMPATHVFDHALATGYGTMDLLAAFLFCNVAYKDMLRKTAQAGIECPKFAHRLMWQSGLLGAALLAIIYTGFMWISYHHAGHLQGVPTARIIYAVAHVILGHYGALFIGIAVTIACIATATTLIECSTDFFYNSVFKRRPHRTACLLLAVVMTYTVAVVGFQGIMNFSLPILKWVYPALVAYCLFMLVRHGVHVYRQRQQQAGGPAST